MYSSVDPLIISQGLDVKHISCIMMVVLSFRFALHICHSLEVLLQADEESTREYIIEELGLHHCVKSKRLIDIFGDLLTSTISCEPYKK